MSQSPLEQNDTIFCEMISHPAIFTHRQPEKMAIFGNEQSNILAEIKKHSHIAVVSNPKNMQPDSFDIIINTDVPLPGHLQQYRNSLREGGIFMQQSGSPFHLAVLKNMTQELTAAGFQDIQTLNFPHPIFPTGWRSVLIAAKEGTLRRPREKDIFNKSFITQYYNFDTHKAAMVLPEFMRELLNEKI